MPDIAGRAEHEAEHLRFAETRWSLVAAAAEARRPLAELCMHYWFPVFAYARRMGHPPESAQNITRCFFQSLVGERLAALRSDPPRRFREWLQAELSRFLADVWPDRAAQAVEGEPHPPLPSEALERRFAAEANVAASAEQGFSRSFALELLGRAAQRLRGEAREAGREAMFARLAPFLTAEPTAPDYAAISTELGVATLPLVVALKRLRQRYRELVDDELAQTVQSHEDLPAERAALHAALRDRD